MEQDKIDEIVRLSRRGAKVMFGKCHSGKWRVKIHYGPMGLLTKRMEINPTSYENLSRELDVQGI